MIFSDELECLTLSSFSIMARFRAYTHMSYLIGKTFQGQTV